MLQTKWSSVFSFFRLPKTQPSSRPAMKTANHYEQLAVKQPDSSSVGLLSRIKAAAPGRDAIFLQKVLEVIYARLSDHRFQVAALARALGLSQSQLFRRLKACTGYSANVLIRQVRLQQAKDWLEASDLNMSEIAYDCGFGSPAHFTHVFTKAFGLPPSAYRENFRK